MKTASQDVKLDFERHRRIGIHEAIFAEGKSPEQLEVIFDLAGRRGVSLLVTRLSAEKYRSLSPGVIAVLDYCATSKTAIFGIIPPPPASTPEVAIVAAGSSDAAVAREAQRTLQFNGTPSTLMIDVGVAGLWRLTERLDELRRCSIVIAVAGMDAALPTVLGGLIPAFIVAVPTSVGYGVAAGGAAALHAILASCAPGITVVNIDNGYGAACAALRVLAIGATHTVSVSSSPEPLARMPATAT